MGYPISPIVANLFIEEFEIKAINTATNPPRIWLKYVNDTFVIQKAEHTYQFLQHINSIDLPMQFTAETPIQMDPYPFQTPKLHLDLTTHFSQQSTVRPVPSLGQPP